MILNHKKVIYILYYVPALSSHEMSYPVHQSTPKKKKKKKKKKSIQLERITNLGKNIGKILFKLREKYWKAFNPLQGIHKLRV